MRRMVQAIVGTFVAVLTFSSPAVAQYAGVDLKPVGLDLQSGVSQPIALGACFGIVFQVDNKGSTAFPASASWNCSFRLSTNTDLDASGTVAFFCTGGGLFTGSKADLNTAILKDLKVPTSLPSGDYWVKIYVSPLPGESNPNNQVLIGPKIKIGSPQPQVGDIDVTPTSVSRSYTIGGSLPSSEALTVKNLGPGPLDWKLTSSLPSWLTLSTTGGNSLAVQASKSTTLGFVVSGLGPSTYTHTLVFGNVNNSSDTESVSVTLVVSNPATADLDVQPDSVSFGGTVGSTVTSPPAATFQIINLGSVACSWTIVEQPTASWLSESPASGGALGGGQSDSCTLTVQPAGLSAGTHVCTLRVQDPANPSGNFDLLTVTLDMSAAPSAGLTVAPASVQGTYAMGEAPPQDVVLTLTNDGAVSLIWSSTEQSAQTWYQLVPSNGTIPAGGSATATVKFDVNAISSGPNGSKLHFTGASLPTAVVVPIAIDVPNAFAVGDWRITAPQLAKSGLTVTTLGDTLLARDDSPAALRLDTSHSYLYSDCAAVSLAAQTITPKPVAGATVSLVSSLSSPAVVICSVAPVLHVIGDALHVSSPAYAGFGVAGLLVNIEDIRVDESPPAIRLEGKLKLPDLLDGTTVDYEDLLLGPAGLEGVKVNVDPTKKFKLAKSNWSLDALTLAFDAPQQRLEAAAKLDVKLFKVKCGFAIVSGGVDALEIEFDFGDNPIWFGPPVPPVLCVPTLFALVALGGKIENLSGTSGQPLKVTGTAGVDALHDSCILPGKKISWLAGYPIQLSLDAAHVVKVLGEVNLFEPNDETPIDFWLGPVHSSWEGYPLAKVVARIEPQQGLTIDEAWLDVLDILTLQIDSLTIDPLLHVLGKATGELKIPGWVPPPFGNLLLVGAQAWVNDSALVAGAQAFGVEVTAKVLGPAQEQVDAETCRGKRE